MKIKSIVSVVAILLLLSALGYFYFFVERLSSVQIARFKNNSEATGFFITFNIETELTRYDVYLLSQKKADWNERITQIDSIKDPEMQDQEQEKLLADMMRDPMMEKLLGKLADFGGKIIMVIVRTIFGIPPL